MRDYNYKSPCGRLIPVAQLPTELIHLQLFTGVRSLAGDESKGETDKVRERLELELFIRENNLRG